VLRVTTLYASSAVATATYYTRYLAEAPGEVPGVWTGGQAAALGLSRDVSGNALELLLEGRDPTSGSPLGHNLDGVGDHLHFEPGFAMATHPNVVVEAACAPRPDPVTPRADTRCSRADGPIRSSVEHESF
jgi:hypothetical protein